MAEKQLAADQVPPSGGGGPPDPHKDTHKSGGSDAFTAADLLEAVVKRIRESGGSVDLTMGAVADGQYIRRSGTTIIGDTPSTAVADGTISFAKLKATLVLDVSIGSATAQYVIENAGGPNVNQPYILSLITSAVGGEVSAAISAGDDNIVTGQSKVAVTQIVAGGNYRLKAFRLELT